MDPNEQLVRTTGRLLLALNLSLAVLLAWVTSPWPSPELMVAAPAHINSNEIESNRIKPPEIAPTLAVSQTLPSKKPIMHASVQHRASTNSTKKLSSTASTSDTAVKPIPVSLVPSVGTRTGSSGLRRLEKLSNQQSNPNHSAGYVDHLIDPNIAEDDFSFLGAPGQNANRLSNIDHSLQTLALYRDDNNYFDGTLDYGLHYIARMNTVNWGQIRLNAIAIREYQDYGGPIAGPTGYYQANSGLSRLSIEQYGLPITDTISMDNIWGTHRQVRYNPYRNRPNLVNSRFGAAEPDIQGISSHLRFGRSSLSLSGGDLGRTQGAVLPGFRESQGSVRRGQFTHTQERNAVSGEFWRTSDLQTVDNRRGYRLGYDRLLGQNTTLSFTTVASGDARAHLAGGSTESEFSRHDFGAYWFDEDLLWLDTKIGDDNGGAFYRYAGQRGTLNWGSSIELRRDGLSGNNLAQRDTGFFSANLSNRLSRRSNLSGAYSFRRVRGDNSNSIDYNEHNLRSFYTLNHKGRARSSVGLHMRHRGQDSELDLSYGWAKDLRADSTAEIESSYRIAQLQGAQARELRLAMRWSKQFLKGQFLSLGMGYTTGTSAFEDNQGFTGFINFDSPITDRLGLSVQIDYSRSQSEYQDQDLSGTLFTNNQFDTENLSSYRELSALLKVSYRLNGRGNQHTLGAGGRRNGAGGLRGVVYVDKNGDGQRQANEPGVKGINIFLNSVYPTVTDANGEYSFPAVGIGEHFLMIDETNLPLPWSLSKGEYTPVSVGLRRTTIVNIPLSTISLADAG